MPTFAPVSRGRLRCSPAKRTRLTAASSKITKPLVFERDYFFLFGFGAKYREGGDRF
jgi:hypothetical protein